MSERISQSGMLYRLVQNQMPDGKMIGSFRKFYHNNKTGKWEATRHGIEFPMEEFEGIRAMFNGEKQAPVAPPKAPKTPKAKVVEIKSSEIPF